MKYVTPEISWHGRDPIYSVDFQYLKGDIRRLVTCGTDRHVRIWQVTSDQDGKAVVEFLASLTRHTRTVNVVRFSPDGQVLASGGDDSVVMLWRLNPTPPGSNNIFQEEESENKENWSVFKVLRSHLEDVYDICWSSCGKFLISGSVDNSAILWDVKKGSRLGIFPDHKSFVQGVAFDPLNEYLATMSSDRSLRIYSFESKNCLHTVNKVTFPVVNNNETCEKTFKMFHDDTMKSFFRRLCFTPDGQLLIVPAGCIDKGAGEQADNTTYLFSRKNLIKPILHLPGPSKSALAARACPVLYELRKILKKNTIDPIAKENSNGSENSNPLEELKEWQKYETLFSLPYRIVFAIATEDAVFLYDTQQMQPFAYIANIHYHTISDIAWSPDAKYLVVSSTDGYCTVISFDEGELGIPISSQPVHIYSQSEIDLKNEIKKKELEKKKKPKEKQQGCNSSSPNSVSSTTDEVTGSVQQKENGSAPSTDPAESKSTKRRVVLTTLVKPVSESAQKPEKDSGNNPQQDVELKTEVDACNIQPNKMEEDESSKQMASTVCPSSCSLEPKNNQMSVTNQNSEGVKEKKARRVGITTLTTFSKEKEPTPLLNTDVNTDLVMEEDTSNLNLVLEGTADESLKTTDNTSKTPSKGPLSSADGKLSIKTPRRIKPVMLESASPSTSAGQSPKSQNSPQPRRVPLKTISTPQK